MLSLLKRETAGILPGLILSLALSASSQLLAGLIPAAGAALIAILLGMLLGNTVLKSPLLEPGTRFAEKRLLEYAIVLNGLVLSFQALAGAGFSSFLYVIIQMTATLGFTYAIGRMLGFKKSFSLLMSAGNAVCGSSAIGTVAPIVRADSKDKGISITTVNIVGTVLMLFLPALTGWFYQQQVLPTSALIGGVIQSVGQVVASAKLVSEEVVDLATVFKLMRVLLLVAVAVLYSRLNLMEAEPLFVGEKNRRENVSSGVKVGVPWFVAGFVVLVVIRSLFDLPGALISSADWIGSQFETAALAAIGMRVKFSDVVAEGPKVMLYGFVVAVFQIAAAVLLIGMFF